MITVVIALLVAALAYLVAASLTDSEIFGILAAIVVLIASSQFYGLGRPRPSR